MKFITFQEICKLSISPATCYHWASEMLLHKQDAILPPKISMKPMDGVFCNVMPSIISDNNRKYGGIKTVTRYPGRTPTLDSMLTLFDADTGEFLALMDANWITAMRTGAVAVHSIMLLAKRHFSEISILGLGNTARAALLVLAEMMPEQIFHIKLLRYKGQEALFAERFNNYSNIKFSFADDYKSLIKGSEVIISAPTYLSNDICEYEYFDEGVLVVPIHTLGFTNCDLFFDRVFADDTAHVCDFKNFNKFKYFAEISDVLNQNALGRQTEKERILAYNIGISIHDVYFASKIYQMLFDRSDLPEINLNGPADKFWI